MRKATLFIPDLTDEALDLVSVITAIESNPIRGKAFFEMNACNALILPGAMSDINPTRYGKEDEACRFVDNGTDDFWQLLCDEFIKKKRAVYGIGRGMQFLNVYFGGTLIQDLEDKDMHDWNAPERDHRIHPVTAEKGSWLEEIYGSTFSVSSSHHQAIDRLADDLVADAYAPDGTIEAFHHKQWPIYGVQWHPEWMTLDFLSDKTADGVKDIQYFINHSFGGYY